MKHTHMQSPPKQESGSDTALDVGLGVFGGTVSVATLAVGIVKWRRIRRAANPAFLGDQTAEMGNYFNMFQTPNPVFTPQFASDVNKLTSDMKDTLQRVQAKFGKFGYGQEAEQQLKTAVAGNKQLFRELERITNLEGRDADTLSMYAGQIGRKDLIAIANNSDVLAAAESEVREAVNTYNTVAKSLTRTGAEDADGLRALLVFH